MRCCRSPLCTQCIPVHPPLHITSSATLCTCLRLHLPPPAPLCTDRCTASAASAASAPQQTPCFLSAPHLHPLRTLRQLVKDIDNRITILIERGGAPIIFGTERKGAPDARALPSWNARRHARCHPRRRHPRIVTQARPTRTSRWSVCWQRSSRRTRAWMTWAISSRTRHLRRGCRRAPMMRCTTESAMPCTIPCSAPYHAVHPTVRSYPLGRARNAPRSAPRNAP